MDPETAAGGDGDDFIFNEYAIDDTLDPLQRLVKYHNSDFSLQRLVLIRELADTANFAGFQETVAQLLPLLRNFVQDSEPTVRHVFAQQLFPLAEYVVRNGEDKGYQECINTLLPYTVELLVDKNVEVGCAALQTMKKIANLVRDEHVEQHVLQVLLTLAKDDRAEDYRVVAAQLFDELAEKLGPKATEATLSEVSTLANDPSFSVRRTVAFSLSNICRVLGQAKADELVLPMYHALCKDEVWGVRKACAESIVSMSQNVSNKARLNLIPTFKDLSEDSSRWVRVAAYQNLGQFIHTMQRDDVTSMFLKIFTDMAFQSDGGDSDFAEYCAFSFPAVVQVMGPTRWGELDDAYATLLKDVQWKVRRSLSYSLHEIAKIIGTEHSEKSLVTALELFVRDLDEVKLGVLHKIDEFLAVLTPATRAKYVPVISSVESENWRLRDAVAQKLGAIAALVPPDVVAAHIGESVLRLLDDSVIDVRCSTYHSAAAVLKRLDEADDRKYFAEYSQPIMALATKNNFQSRQMYIYITQQAIELDAKKVAEKMLDHFPALAEDPVSNVRFVLARVFANSIANNPAWRAHPKAAAAGAKLVEDPSAEVRAMATAQRARLENIARAAAYRE